VFIARFVRLSAIVRQIWYQVKSIYILIIKRPLSLSSVYDGFLLEEMKSFRTASIIRNRQVFHLVGQGEIRQLPMKTWIHPKDKK
jgi:hypothetical protein